MKKIGTLTAAAAFAIALGLMYPASASAGIFDDLKAFWDFDSTTQADPVPDVAPADSVADDADLEGDADYQSNISGGDLPPIPGNVDTYEGVDGGDHAEAADSADLSVTGDLTLAAWVKRDTTGAGDEIVSKWDIESTNDLSYELFVDSADKIVLAISKTGGVVLMVARSDATFTDTADWHHIAGTYETSGPTMKLYLDGTEIASTLDGATTQNAIFDSDATVQIGKRVQFAGTSDDQEFDGLIDNVMIYARELSANEIATLAAGDALVDGCGDGLKDPDTDIKSVEATSDGSVITVVVVLCGPIEKGDKYRVHFDYEDPLFTVDGSSEDRDGDSDVDADDFCATTSDDTMKLTRRGGSVNKITGPSTTGTRITVDLGGGMPVLTYTVNYSDLDGRADDVTLVGGDMVAIWVDAHFKGINDRAPDTDGTDSCSKPENENEVIKITLKSPPV